MPVQLLGALFAATISVTGVLLADRERYVHSFRAFDLSFIQSMLLSKAQKSGEIQKTYREIAKVFLRRSQDFRRVGLYSSFYMAHLVVCTTCFGLSFVSDYFVGGDLWFPSFSVGILFGILSIVGWLDRYRIAFTASSKRALLRKVTLLYERISWKLSTKFPPLIPPLTPTHLARWPEATAQIDDEMMLFLRRMKDSQDLIHHGLLT